jgi:hypothetical protein
MSFHPSKYNSREFILQNNEKALEELGMAVEEPEEGHFGNVYFIESPHITHTVGYHNLATFLKGVKLYKELLEVKDA